MILVLVCWIAVITVDCSVDCNFVGLIAVIKERGALFLH